MAQICLTQRQARQFLLSYQGLLPPRRWKGKPGILDYISRVGCIQFDPLNMAGYNQELVLQSRIANFRPSMLEELLYTDRQLVDGWDKNMSIYPVEDWPYFQRNRDASRQSLGNDSRPAAAILPEIRREFEIRGPLSSADIDFNETVDWWWAPTRLSRAALESMYFWGELVVHHKTRTRKVYDLAHRHIPQNLLHMPDPNPTEEQFHDWYVLRRIGSIGLLWNKSGDAWLGISGMKSQARAGAFQRLLEQGKILQVEVEGIHFPLYLRSQDTAYLERVMEGTPVPGHAAILAPLDNLLWDRQLIKQLFHFDYRWEVYKPASERQYGYYVLPVLYGDRFVARFEPVKDKKSKALVIRNWWWEPDIKQTKKLQEGLSRCFQEFIAYLDVQHVEISPDLMLREHLGWLVESIAAVNK